MKPLTRNITRVFRTATPEQIEAGRTWYTKAHTIANTLSDTHDVPLNTVAGIIAALSPLNSWGVNVNLATQFLSRGGLDSGYLTRGLQTARFIYDGAEPSTILGGRKVRAFYEAIRTKGNTDFVCIDRHAFDLVTNTRLNTQTLTLKRYTDAVDKYRRATHILNKEYNEDFSPTQVQAITWVTWRSRFWSEGAFDNYNKEALHASV